MNKLVLLLVFLLPFPFLAQENLLDSSFGTNNGSTEISLYNGSKVSSVQLYDSAKLPNGKILAVGTGIIARFTTDGHLDTSFHGTGYKKITPLGNYNQIKPANDGNYLLIDGASGGKIEKIDEDGNLVTSFNTFNQTLKYADVDVDLAGNIYVLIAVNSRHGILRLLPNGILDTFYGTNGEINLGTNYIYDKIIVKDSNEIFLGGKQQISTTNRKIVVSKLSPNGSLDTSFGSGGHFTYQGGQYVGDRTFIDVLPDGSVVGFTSGSLCNGANCFGLILYKIKFDGTLDTTFFNGGIGVIPVQSSSDPSKIQRLNDGSYIISGTGIRTMYAVKIDKFGILDTAFGTNGRIITPELSPIGYPAYNTNFELFGKSIVFLGMYSIGGGGGTIYVSVLRKYFFSPDSASAPEFANVKVKLFPNPAKDYIQFETDKKIDSYVIYDVLGREIVRESSIENTIIDLQKLKTGIYWVNFISTDGLQGSYRIIKE